MNNDANATLNKLSGILALIEEIAKKGVKEIVLTGVNIGDFGIQQGIT